MVSTALRRLRAGKEERGYVSCDGTTVRIFRRNEDGSKAIDQTRYLSSTYAAKIAYEEALAAAYADGYEIAPPPMSPKAPVKRERIIDKSDWDRVIRAEVLDVYDDNYGIYTDTPSREEALSFVPYDVDPGWDGFCDDLRFKFNLTQDELGDLLFGSIEEIIAEMPQWWDGRLTDFVD